MNDTVVFYNGEQVSVPKEVAEFLEQDRKRTQAQTRQDKRHLSRSEFETVLSSHVPAGRPLERSVLRNLQLENLRNAVAELNAREQELISLRYDGDLSMEEIGKVFGISKMAVSKRLKKLHAKLRSSVFKWQRVSQPGSFLLHRATCSTSAWRTATAASKTVCWISRTTRRPICSSLPCRKSCTSGLEQQIERFLTSHLDTALIVIDTLQRIRSGVNDANPYASDYRDLGILKELADRHRIAILLIHHLRKMSDDDPMNMISGTTGISGATDTNFVLRKSKRSSSSATLYCTGRDIEYRELLLEFDGTEHIWKLREDSVEQPTQVQDELVFFLSEFLDQRKCFTGTATELAEKLNRFAGEQYKPNVLMKKLIRCQQELLELGITLSTRRTHDRRELTLRVSCVSNDGKNDTGPVSDLLSQLSQLSQERPAPPE